MKCSDARLLRPVSQRKLRHEAVDLFLKGKKIKALYMTGGGAKNPYLIKLIMKFLKEEFKKEYLKIKICV